MMYEVKRQQLPNGEVMAYREENTAVDAPVLLLNPWKSKLFSVL